VPPRISPARSLLAAALGLALLAAAPAARAVTPSDGCGESTPSDGSRTVTVSGAPGGNSSYELDVPSGGFDNTDPYPLLVAYHGTGGSGGGLTGFCGQYYGDFRGEGVGQDAILVCPDAEGTGIDWDESWDMDFFDAMMADLEAILCIDLDKIYVTGHSAGAGFAHRLGCAKGDVVRAIAPVAGFQSGSECSSPVGDVAAIVIHGEDDTEVSQASAEALRDYWMGRNSCTAGNAFNVSPADCDTHKGYSDCDSDNPVEWCLEADYGHLDYWSIPTCSMQVPPPFCSNPGTSNIAVPALWNFFTSLSDPATVTPIFSDGFESGDLSAWFAAVGDAAASVGASLAGSFGLEIGLGDLCSYDDTDLTVTGPTTTGTSNACNSIATSGTVTVLTGATFNAGAWVGLADGFSSGLADFTASLEPAVIPFSWVEDDTPSALAGYFASWLVSADDLTTIDPDMDFGHLAGYAADGTLLFRVSIRRNTGPTENRLALEARSGGALVEHGTEFLLPAGTSDVQIHWSAGAGSGELMISFDGGSTFSGLGSLDNGGLALERVRLGFVDGEIGATGGFLAADEFDSWF